MKNPINIFWFRRDLRLDDNHGLFAALNSGLPVLGVFIFDTEILDKLEQKSDARLQFIHSRIQAINDLLEPHGSKILAIHSTVEEAFRKILSQFTVHRVYCNRDYEPYAKERDQQVQLLCQANGVDFSAFKDQVIFESDEVLKDDGKPYTVFTPYSRKWKARYAENKPEFKASENMLSRFAPNNSSLPTLEELGFVPSPIPVPAIRIEKDRLSAYEASRNFPSQDGTSHAGIHLRFGTISVRNLVALANQQSETYLNELIWREFFMQILDHFPHVVTENYHSKYNRIAWRNDEGEFKKWCEGKTGYPIVDAGMRELLQTGNMHNRVRMITASFLTKHLLIDWRWGEAWFARHLLDYELASNNGNWQWAAGTGCDAAPYFRVFNPTEQQKKFDTEGRYTRKWLPELDSFSYPKPIIDHKFARERALKTYKEALGN